MQGMGIGMGPTEWRSAWEVGELRRGLMAMPGLGTLSAQSPRSVVYGVARGHGCRAAFGDSRRAPVVQERIETEMRSASGITNGHGKYIAGVVLITAGYSAEGKYSHFFLTQVPLRLGAETRLAAGEYVIGYEHEEE